MPTGTMRSLFVDSSSSSSSGSGRDREPEPAAAAAAVLCAPRPRRVQGHPSSADLILGPPPFLLNSSGNTRKQREGKSKTGEEDEEGCWALFGGSPPARADNPLVHDPHFLLNQRHHAASDINLAVFDTHRNHHHHVPTYSNSNNNSSSSHSFAPSYAPAVRIQGFDVASCRSSHGGNGGGRVLSARA